MIITADMFKETDFSSNIYQRLKEFDEWDHTEFLSMLERENDVKSAEIILNKIQSNSKNTKVFKEKIENFENHEEYNLVRSLSYFHAGNLVVNGLVDIKGSLLVLGNITVNGTLKVTGKVKSWKSIKVNRGVFAKSIEADEDIISGDYISAMYGISSSRGDIKAKSTIKCDHITAEGNIFTDGRINCNTFMSAKKTISARKSITCGGWLCADSLYSGDIVTQNNIQCNWSIESKGIISALSIKTNGPIKARRYISSDIFIEASRITAGENIIAGYNITVKSEIITEPDYGIYVGMRLPISEQKEKAFVMASNQPKNLLLGKFIEDPKSIVPF